MTFKNSTDTHSEKRSGEVFPQQGQRDHQLTEQPSEGIGPPGQIPQAEWFPTNFICSPFAPPPPPQVLDTSSPERDQEKENRPPVMMIPYDVGMSENIRHVCRTLYIRVVFKSGQSLRRKDTLP